jgi:hypothetical protein
MSDLIKHREDVWGKRSAKHRENVWGKRSAK